MPFSLSHGSDLGVFARGPVVIFRWRNAAGWPVEFVSTNAAEVFGYSADQFKSGEVVYASLVHSEDLDRVMAEVVEGSREESFIHEPYRVRHADGSTRWLYDMTHVIREPGQPEPIAFLGYVVDITKQIDAENERHALELKLLQTQKLESLGILASGVAHDFNNFLTGIMGEAELARLMLGEDRPDVVARLESIERLATRAAEVTQQLLTYTGKRQNPPRPVRLDDLVREVVAMLRTVLSPKATLDLDLRRVSTIVADRSQMTQVIMNLLTNASDALMGEEGKIFLSVSQLVDNSGGAVAVRLCVRDTGCGMTESVRSRLFDPFFTTKDTGRGLGMSAVQGIVRAHHGEIAVESIVGQGTKFILTFPIPPAAT